MIEIIEVKSQKQLKQFISFADTLYKTNPYRATPLHSLEIATLDWSKNPAFEYCEAAYFLAYRENKIVGRIAGIINTKSNELFNEKCVRVGWLDFIDDDEVSQALFATVENWGVSKGMNVAKGPLGFTDMDLEGMLVEGFDEMSTQAVLYNHAYYPRHIEKWGYKKDVDWLQFEIKVPKEVPQRISRMANIVKEKYGLRILKAKSSKDFLPYAEKMFHTLNGAFQELYEFVPLSDAQIKHYTKLYFSLINPKYVCFVIDEDDDVAGFGISILSISKALIKAKGKLYPFGFIHILNALYRNDTVDMHLQGVNPKYKKKGVLTIFYNEMMQAYIDNGIKTAITSHILENNHDSFGMFEAFEHRQHLRRRSYTKDHLKTQSL